MILTITLNPTIDIVAVISAIKLSSVTRSPDIFSYPGGKATNTARAAAALGAKVIAAGFAGASDIAAMNSFFSKHNVTGSFTAVPGKNRICLLLTETETKQETIINSESNLRISVSKKSELLETVAALSKKATHAVISGSLPLCLPSNFYATLINKIKNNCTVILDTSSKYLTEGIKAKPHIIKQNLSELENAFKINLNSRQKLKKFIMKISKKYGIKTVIVTVDKAGAVVCDSGKFFFIPAIKSKNTLSPVGCGDAFSAGLVYGLSKWKSLKNACALASACAHANLFHTGSCFITRKEALKYLKLINFKVYQDMIAAR